MGVDEFVDGGVLVPPLLDVFVVVVVFFVVDIFTSEATTGGALAANISRILVLALRGTTIIAAAFSRCRCIRRRR